MGLRALCSGHNWALAEAGVTEVQQGAGLTRGVTGTGERGGCLRLGSVGDA